MAGCLIELELPPADRGVVSVDLPKGSRMLGFILIPVEPRVHGAPLDLVLRATFQVPDQDAVAHRLHYTARFAGQSLPENARFVDFAALPVRLGAARVYLFALELEAASAARAAYTAGTKAHANA